LPLAPLAAFSRSVFEYYAKQLISWSFLCEQVFQAILANTSLVARGALAYRLQRRTACKIENGRQGGQKWPTGSGKVLTLRFLGVLSNLSFLYEHSFYEKGSCWRKKKRGKRGEKKKKRMMKIVAISALPAVDRPTAGKLHANAN